MSFARSCSRFAETFPRRYYEELPTLVSGRWRRYPRVYVFARDFVAHTAGRFNQELLHRFADAYQDVTPLTIGELWAIPIMLRLALVENLSGLAVQTLRARQDRDAARTFASELLQIPETERRLRQLTDKASSTFLVEILHNLRDQSVASTAAWRWLQTRLSARGQSSDEVLRVEQQREAIDQLSIANIINTMRVLSALDWPTFVEAVSRVERILRRDPAGAYVDMDRPTRDRYRKSVEQLARRSGTDELEVAERAIAAAETALRERPHADRSHHVGYYLISRGRFELERAVDYTPTIGERIARLVFKHPAIGYLGTLLLTTALFETSLLLYAQNHGASPWMIVLVGARHRPPGLRARVELPEHDTHHADSSSGAAEARIAQRRARRAADDRRGADHSVVDGPRERARRRARSARARKPR